MSLGGQKAALCRYRCDDTVALLVVIEHLVRGGAVDLGEGIIPSAPRLRALSQAVGEDFYSIDPTFKIVLAWPFLNGYIIQPVRERAAR